MQGTRNTSLPRTGSCKVNGADFRGFCTFRTHQQKKDSHCQNILGDCQERPYSCITKKSTSAFFQICSVVALMKDKCLIMTRNQGQQPKRSLAYIHLFNHSALLSLIFIITNIYYLLLIIINNLITNNSDIYHMNINRCFFSEV